MRLHVTAFSLTAGLIWGARFFLGVIAGEPLRVVTERVRMRGRTLRWLLERIDTGRPYYLSGELRVGRGVEPVEDLDRYQPAVLSGGVLKLHYARAEALSAYLDRIASEGEVYVQFWLKTGDPPVALEAGDEEAAEVIPEVLRGYL